MKTIIFTNKHGNKFRVEGMELAEAVEKYRPSIGLDARWLPEFLEGAETRTVSGGFDKDGNEYFTTEYLHPAEYTYEIVEESLDAIKAKKKAKLAIYSENANPYIHGILAYRVANIGTEYYIRKGLVDKHNRYADDYAAKSDACVTELARCNAAVDIATTEEEVNQVTFAVEF